MICRERQQSDAHPPPINKKTASRLLTPGAANSEWEDCKSPKGKHNDTGVTWQARHSLLRGLAGEQLNAIAVTAELAGAYHAANDDRAVAYLAKRIAAHCCALGQTVDDIAAINSGRRAP